MPIGGRIRLARKRARLSQEALALQVGITKQAISKYEHEKATPSSAVLIDLAQAAGVTVDFLMRPTTVELQELRFRKLQRLGARDQDALEAYAQDALERQLTLERIVYGGDCPRYKAPRTIPVNSEDDAEAAAEKCRQVLKLGWDPVANLTEVLESWCVRIIVGPTDVQDFDGVSDWVVEGVPFIMVTGDADKPGDRQRFTIAHELGHLLCQLPSSLDEEDVANRFAGAFLLPKRALITELGNKRSRLDWRELFRLKKTHGISAAALLFRARDCAIITEKTCNKMRRELSRQGWRKKEPVELPRETPHGTDKLLDRALAEGLIGTSRAAELCGMSLAEFQAKRTERLPENVCSN